MIEAVRSQALERASRLFEGLSGTLVYRMDPPERMNIVYNDDAEIVHDLAATEDSLYVATGGKGRLYRIREDFTRQAYFKGKHRLVLSVGLKDGRPERMTTGEGGALVTRRPSDRVRYRYRSPVLDAQLLSRWGRITSRAEGTIRIRTRSGNTAQPDNSWSDWSAWKNAESMSIVSPPARFIQVEVAFGGPDASLRQLEIAYRVPNQRPRISQLSVSPNPLRERLFRSRSVSGNGSAGSRSSGSSNTSSNSSSGSPKQRQVNWNIVDPDGDPHRVRLFYRRLGESRWISFTGDQPVSEDHYTVNLQNLADGQYEIRLVATDRPFNDPGKGFKVEKTAGPMLVDNTAPGLRDWSVEGPRVSFRVVDETSRIVFAQYRVNGGPWNGLMPEDGIYDQTRERFQFSLTDRSPQEGDVLEVRTMDESGNLTTTRHSFR